MASYRESVWIECYSSRIRLCWKEIWTAFRPWPFACLDHIAVVRQCCRYMENPEFQL